MPAVQGGKLCRKDVWTTVYEGGTFGWINLYLAPGAGTYVTIKWRRYSTGLPWYSEGSAKLMSGRQTQIFHGGPSLYMQFQIKAPTDIVITPS